MMDRCCDFVCLQKFRCASLNFLKKFGVPPSNTRVGTQLSCSPADILTRKRTAQYAAALGNSSGYDGR